MKKRICIEPEAPQYIVATDVAFAQVDAWCGHSRKDLKMDLVYPEDRKKTYPCVVWICGGSWLEMDKSAHLAYLTELARNGFVAASVQYRTSNEAKFPAQLQDVKAGIRYLRAHADRYRIDPGRIGVMGESAGGYLACMAALDRDPAQDVGAYLEYSSAVKAACPWYPPTDLSAFPHSSAEQCAASAESLLLGKSAMRDPRRAWQYSPLSLVTGEAPPFLIIHGDRDHIVPFSQGERLHDALEQAGCDVTLLIVEGADHAEIRFFQREIWEEITAFFRKNL